jgi:hypothetical protein
LRASFSLRGEKCLAVSTLKQLPATQYIYWFTVGDAIGQDSVQVPNLPKDIAGAVVMKSLIGPIFGGLSIGDSDHRKWFFGLGRIF